MDMEQRRKWNENHKKLKEIILKTEEHSQIVQLFLFQHSLLHSSSIGQKVQVTLEDEVMKNLDQTTFRQYPVPNPDTKNSIAWHLWHIARIEDMTMNILVNDDQQVLYTANWLEKMNIAFAHSGNDMPEGDIAELSSRIDMDSLLAYRAAVGRQTQKVISSLIPGQFKTKVEQKRIKRLFDENAVMQHSKWLAEYWSKKTIAGIILMPATRHIFLHLNKCIRIKDKLNKQSMKLIIDKKMVALD
ncbi:DinB family protein [Lederbergia citri]|uniref:DinB family protein n=1 Tax=Lederbergia citri TaxID=2833580 RepID=A0A942TGV8_9BACI|nr:DinB family protein [Lederbergia citri]MBS4196546.1 DinB family protein [Lederbergia citri]